MHKHVVARHMFRRIARQRERALTEVLDAANSPGFTATDEARRGNARASLSAIPVDGKPGLSRTWGVKTVKADGDEPGRWLVVATPPRA
jgi:hypothetical protein